MRLRKFFSCCIALLLCLAISAPAFSAPLTKVRTAWMDEFEAFPIWYAKEKGWDKEAGLDLEILYFTSGMAILNALPSGEWQYAAIGAVPAMMGALRYNTYVIANADEEFLINRVLVRRAYGKAEQQGDTATEKLSEAHTFLLMKKILVNATRAASSEEATSFVSVPGPNSRP